VKGNTTRLLTTGDEPRGKKREGVPGNKNVGNWDESSLKSERGRMGGGVGEEGKRKMTGGNFPPAREDDTKSFRASPKSKKKTPKRG